MKTFLKKEKMKKMPQIHLEHGKHAELHHEVKHKMHQEMQKHFLMLIAIVVIAMIIAGGTIYYLYALDKTISEKRNVQLNFSQLGNTNPSLSSKISIYSLQRPQFSLLTLLHLG